MSSPADDLVKTNVRSYSFGVPGKALNQARTNHWVIDSSTNPEAVSTVESFLSGVSACGVTLIDGLARTEGIPLQRIEVNIEGVRKHSEPGRFQEVNMRFALTGVTQEQADHLVGGYKER
ncbi:MAG: OsmC family protein [Chloroflexi bacterium]|nr:OsmC family protein [Chloroflexota bacterium]